MKSNIVYFGLFYMFLFVITISSCVKEKSNSEIPTCRITSPTNGQEIVKGETVIISVDTDDITSNILEVRFFIDGIGKTSVTSFPYNYEWNTSTDNLGNHTIKASSIDSGGEVNTDEITVLLVDAIVVGNIPIANFSANAISGESPLVVTFSDLTSNNPTSWNWSFGDGSTSNEQNPEHTFDTDGSYTVSLIATNNEGADTLVKANYISVGNNGGGNGEPCPGTPTVTDVDGNTYNTVLIGNQCWMKENLRVGMRINGAENMLDDDVVEKYCYDDDLANCETYGGLYQWVEMMNYTNQEGAQGICPSGWHIPSDQDWKNMEMYLGMSQTEANAPDWRGDDEGDKLKTTTGWLDGGNGTNSSGFTALPSGYRAGEDSGFEALGNSAFWWTSTPFSDVQTWYRSVGPYVSKIQRTYNYNGSGISVRCIKD